MLILFIFLVCTVDREPTHNGKQATTGFENVVLMRVQTLDNDVELSNIMNSSRGVVSFIVD